MSRFFWGFMGAFLFNTSLAAIILSMSAKKIYMLDLVGIFLYITLASVGLAFVVHSFTREESII